MRLSTLIALPIVASTGLLSSCGLPQATQAHRAQAEMIGMTSYDLQACAGIPATTKTLNPSTEIWQYTTSYTPPAIPSSGLIPVGSFVSIWQSIFGDGGSSCTMVVRLDHERISDIHYTGNNDQYFGRDGICSMIIRGCARQPEHTMHTGKAIEQLSPYSSPATPIQNDSATYSEQSKKYTAVLDHSKTQPVIRPVEGDTPVPYIQPKHTHKPKEHKHHHKHDKSQEG